MDTGRRAITTASDVMISNTLGSKERGANCLTRGLPGINIGSRVYPVNFIPNPTPPVDFHTLFPLSCYRFVLLPIRSPLYMFCSVQL